MRLNGAVLRSTSPAVVLLSCALWLAAAPSWAIVSAPATSAPAADTPVSGAAGVAIVQQPRPFGYVLGDTLTQRILLQSAGRNFDPATLPPSERAGLWFARRSSRVEPADDGRRWLVIDYQLVNAPQTLITVNLPSVTLKSKASDSSELVVPEWPISIAPLTPRAAFAKGGLQELRPDHPAPTIPTTALRRQVQIWAGALLLTGLLWLGWWLLRYFRAAANQPFARALREIRRSDDDSETAWLALHRAFDRTAGRSVQLHTIPALLKQAPHFESERAAIEQFYAESNRRFFDVVGAGSRTPVRQTQVAPELSPRALCTTLRRLEKQHER